MPASQELVIPESVTAVMIYESEIGLDPYVEQARALVSAHEPDVSTSTGRKQIGSLAAKVAKLKTRLDGMGKELNAEAKAKIKLVDDTRKRMRDQLDELKIEARKPLTEWEEAEEDRVQSLNFALSVLKDMQITEGRSNMELSDNLESLSNQPDFQEFQERADALMEIAARTISNELNAREEREKMARELEMARQEQARRHEEAEAARLEAKKEQQRRDDEIAKLKADNEQLILEKQQAEKAKVDAENEALRLESEEKQRVIDEAKQKEIEAAAEVERIANEKRLAEEQAAEEVQRVADEKLRQKEMEANRVAIIEEISSDISVYCKTKKSAGQLAAAIVDGEICNVSYFQDSQS